MPLLVRNALLDGLPTDLLAEGGRITALAPGLTPPGEGADILDARGMLLVPGLVNGHTHAAMTLFRGFGDDMSLMEWLQTRIWPAEARLNGEDVYWGTRLACLEMIKTGTIFFQDMYWHYHAVARAVEDAGLRAGVGAILIDVGGGAQTDHLKGEIAKALAERDRYSDRITCTITPHAIYTVGRDNLRWIADLSEKYDTPVHIHLSETQAEVDGCLAEHKLRPAFYLDQVGLLSPRVSLGHGVFLDEAELALIAGRGATVVTNPVSNMKLAVGGVFPYAAAHRLGVPMAMGTDGAASNNGLDLFQDVKFLALIQKHAHHDPTLLPAREAWEIVTGRMGHLPYRSEGIRVGAPADFLLLRPEALAFSPTHDMVSNLVYSATGEVVDTMVVSGRILMHNRRIPDEEEIRREAVARAHAVCALAG